MHTGMPQLELNQNPGSEGCPDPEKDYENDTRHDL